jgi:hypothetical protein
MVEVAEELVEAMHRGEVFVSVPQMVLAEPTGGVAKRLQQLCDRWVFGVKTDSGPQHGNLGQASSGRIAP